VSVRSSEQQSSQLRPSQRGQQSGVYLQPQTNQQASQQQQGQSLLSAPVSQLRSASVSDSSGEQLGQVVEIVGKQDGSQAGVLIKSQEEQNSYQLIPPHQLSMRGEQLVAESRQNTTTLSAEDLRNQNFNRIPDTDRPLGDYVQIARR